MNPKVSILVTVYNVSAYIEKCAESIFNQTFKDIEFIFVNDATPDDSLGKLYKVIKRYPNLKDQIKIIQHKVNKGSGAAKNTAINASTADYIIFVDSDDYIDTNMIDTLYKKAVIDSADIVVSDITLEYNDKSILINEHVSDNPQLYFFDMLVNQRIQSFLCNKLIKRNLYLLPECKLPKGINYLEDRYILTRMCYFANKISKVNQSFYHYVQYNSNAITKTKTKMHFENMTRFWNDMDNFLKVNGEFEKYSYAMELPKVQSKINLFIDTHSSNLRKQYRELFYEEEGRCIHYFKRGEKLMLLLVRYRMYGLAQLFHTYLVFKHKKKLIKH